MSLYYINKALFRHLLLSRNQRFHCHLARRQGPKNASSPSRLIIERFANITDGSVIGVRAPYLRVGGNTQFQMMNDQFFVYDSSIAAPLSRVPVWPYTLLYRSSPENCLFHSKLMGAHACTHACKERQTWVAQGVHKTCSHSKHHRKMLPISASVSCSLSLLGIFFEHISRSRYWMNTRRPLHM